MAAYSHIIAPPERDAIAACVEEFQKGLVSAVKWTPRVDDKRSNAYIVVTGVVPAATTSVFYESRLERIRAADPGVEAVYVLCDGKQTTLVIDLARADIRSDDVCPLAPVPPHCPRAYPPAERSEFDVTHRTATNSPSQLSLARAVAETWNGAAPQLLGDAQCESRSVTVCRIHDKASASTAIVRCAARVAGAFSWSSHAIAALKAVSRHVRRVDLDIEPKGASTLVTVSVFLATPDARTADWVRKPVRAVSFAAPPARIQAIARQAADRARLKAKRRPVF